FAASVPGAAPVPGGPLLFQPDYGQPELDLVIGAASEEPSTTAVPRPAAARTTVGRSWRSGRVISAIGAVVLLLLAGSITAWQLSASPQATPTASPTPSASASSTPAAVAVPDVVGLRFAKATQVLESLGFTVTGKHTSAGLIVTRTNPSGQAPAGGKIIVVY
ncbi:MAG: hypothetical protein QOH87_3493, partial [Trebonia sp.]|nr:hypothetical protein [Trebonia sp.]